ncbi:uncharacterized protein LOC100180091 [Ciona intestinalis]
MKALVALFYIVAALCVNTFGNTYIDNNANVTTVCGTKMFGRDVNAVRSCMTAYALQHNWYPSPIAGLFSYQTWNGFDGFWQDGAVLETLANFMHYANHSMFKTVVTGSNRDVYSLIEAYYPQPSFDDMAWYGLSYVRIHELLGFGDDNTSGFLYSAKKIFDWVWENGWDKTHSCAGGIWFDQTQASKQNVENAQMLQLSSKLFRHTNDTTLLDKIKQIMKFIEVNGLINDTSYMVADGVTNNCTNNEVYGPTYNMGLMIGGLVEAAPILNRTNELIPLAHKVAQATIAHSTKDGILVEYCFPNCDDDAKMFKGIFLRNLRYLIDYSRENDAEIWKENVAAYVKFIQLNSDTAWTYNRCEPIKDNCTVLYKDGVSLHNTTSGPVFGIEYSGPFNFTAPIQQTAVLDLFVSGIGVDVKCTGEYCNFDPPVPGPNPLTCQDNPCPPDQPCCSYYNEYYTCCESVQKCVNGECV